MVRALSLWLPVILVMSIIWNASAMSTSPGPSPMPDWLQHGLAYFTLSAAAVRAFAGGRWAGVTPGALAAGWLLATLYGVTDEWHQMYVPGRFSELRDWVADTVGALAAALAIGAWGIIAKGRE